MNFADQLILAAKEKGNSVCVGLDPRSANLPPELECGSSVQETAQAFEKFCLSIIDVVTDLVPIVKPQSAFFECLGPPGVAALGRIVQYAHEKKLLVLMDAKRGDIGSTAAAYSQAYLGAGRDGLQSDALTVNPYMGVDTLMPFVETARSESKGIFVLVKTSNPGSGHFQDQKLGESGLRLFDRVADEVELLTATDIGSAGYGPVGAVVGATYPEQLGELRRRMPHSILLIPGFGAQGGGVDDVRAGFDRDGLGAIVNSSRGIIFAYEKEEYRGLPWQEAVKQECLKTTQLLSVDALKN